MKRQAAYLFWSFPLGTVLALTLMAGVPAEAQYTAPGTPIPIRHTPSKPEFEDKIQASPWKAGPLVLNPWLGLRDLRFVTDLNTVGATEGDDLTLTVGAGLRGYLPAGSKALFAVHALPEYVWWQDQEDKRRLNGLYGLGLFAFFNRMTLELSQRRVERQSFFSSELQELTSSRNDISTLSLEVEVAPKLTLFGIATLDDYGNQEDENATFSVLDREEQAALLGVRYENDQGWRLELAYMDISADFAQGARDLSNSGSAQLASIGFDRPKIASRLDLSFQEREADDGSEFGVFDETTGSFAVLLRPSRIADVLGYFRRSQVYSADRRYSLYLEERQGARLNLSFDRVKLGVFGEVGEDDFELATAGARDRIDDVTAYGADLGITLREVSLSVRATRTDYDSGLDEFDRDVDSIQFAVELTAVNRFTSRLIDRLSLGSAGSEW